MDYRIKDLPEEERPREKLEQNGVSSLTEVELLSLVLRAGTSGKNVKELSAEILNSYSLDSLADRSLNELKGFDGVSKVKAGQLKAVGELARRMQRSEVEKIETFSDVKDRVQDMKFLGEEKLRVLMLSSGNELLDEKEFQGTVSSVEVSMQKIFRQALKENAAALILTHNHPSGKSEATEKDLDFTREVIDMGEKIGVEVLDHVIVGEKAVSMKKETGLKL